MCMVSSAKKKDSLLWNMAHRVPPLNMKIFHVAPRFNYVREWCYCPHDIPIKIPTISPLHLFVFGIYVTLRKSNMAMEFSPCVDDFPSYKPSFMVGIPNCQVWWRGYLEHIIGHRGFCIPINGVIQCYTFQYHSIIIPLRLGIIICSGIIIASSM